MNRFVITIRETVHHEWTVTVRLIAAGGPVRTVFGELCATSGAAEKVAREWCQSRRNHDFNAHAVARRK